MTILNINVYDDNYDSIEGRNVALIYFDEGANSWSAHSEVTDVDGFVSLDDNGSKNRFLIIEGGPGENDYVKKIASVEKVYG